MRPMAEPNDDATRVLDAAAAKQLAAQAPVAAPAADADATQVRPGALDALAKTPGADAAARTLPGHTLSSLPPGATRLPGGPQAGDAPVRQVGRYLIQGRLGRGGMATVYRASDPQIGRDVAIKFLHASLAEDAECHNRFLQEARAAGGLSHDNIVVVHDVGEIEGRPYMAMELIDGVPLVDVLERTRQIPIRDAVVVGVQLARALDYAHAHGIVHRDIKPGNIMLLRDKRKVKVTDFGIAHIEDGATQRTQVGAVLGTPQYMSPEQTRGEKLDGRSDLFSAGIVLYQMVAGERPFRGDNLVAVATQIANEPAPPLQQARPDAPPALRRVIERCLAKTPAQRFQSGADMADALVKVLGGIDEAARERAKPRIVPLRVKWALAMAAIVAVVMGITAALISQRQYEALLGQASDYGVSLARFIAKQNAAAALGESWDEVDAAVQEMMKTGSFERIVVIDPAGVVRASSQPALLGQAYKPVGTEPLRQAALGEPPGMPVVRYHVNEASILGFEAPVTYQDKLVGRVALGIPEQPLTQVARLSVVLMGVLALVTVLAVALAMVVLANWFARPIKLVGEALGEVAKGNYTHRIAEARKDEFGQLFAEFDSMAQALERRHAPAADSTPAATLTPILMRAAAPPEST